MQRVLDALALQTLSHQEWELILVDNASDTDLASEIDLACHPNARIVREATLGLTAARLRGIQEATGEVLIFVDDDNVLHKEYLQHAIALFQTHPKLGAIGGKSLPDFETPPEPWIRLFWGCLALRDFGETAQIYQFDQAAKQHPEFAPVGAGMVLRRSAAEQYRDRISTDPKRQKFDRTGASLQSGGDCDINLTLLGLGWAVGYFPQLELLHLIPADRVTTEYLARLNRAASRSWVHVLDAHQIRPWRKVAPWTVRPRKLKAMLSYQPWRSPVHYIRWQGACGLFEGLGALPN